MNIFNDPSGPVSQSEERLGARIAARLEEGALDLPHNITERLRAGRVHALLHRRITQTQLAPVLVGAHQPDGTMGAQAPSFWTRASALLPLLALVLGLATIGALHDQERAYELAEVEADLFTADLFPTVYTVSCLLHYF